MLHKNPIDLTENVGDDLPGLLDHLRPLPQPPAGEVDPEALLPDGEPVLAGRRQERAGPRRPHRLSGADGRDHPSPAQRAAGAAAAGRAGAAARRPRPTAASSSPTGSCRPRTRSSRARSSTGSGRTSWAAGWSKAVDDIRDANPASNPALLAALTRDFVAHRFDVKQLVRTIMRLDDLSAVVEADRDQRRRSEVPLALHREAAPGRSDSRRDQPGDGGRAKTSRTIRAGARCSCRTRRSTRYFLTAFGRPPRVTAADSERQQEPSITQALHVINGDTINRKLSAPRGLIQSLIDGNTDNTGRHRTDLSRGAEPPPDRRGAAHAVAGDGRGARARRLAGRRALAQGGGESRRRPVVEDLAWAVLTGREFLFNH